MAKQKQQPRLVILVSTPELNRARQLAAEVGLKTPSTWAASVIRRMLAPTR